MTIAKPLPLAVPLLLSLLIHAAALFGNIGQHQLSKDAPQAWFPDVWNAVPVELLGDTSRASSASGAPPNEPSLAPAEPPRTEQPAAHIGQTPAPVAPATPDPEAAPELPRSAEPSPTKPAASATRRPSPSSSATSTRAEGDAPKPVPARDVAVDSAQPAAPAAPAEEATSSGSASPNVGMVGLPAGMRHFAKAFARALPAGCYADTGWLDLPLGPVGRAVFAVHIDDSGHIEQVERDPAVPAPAIIQRMIDRAIVLLRSGTFSLEPGRASAGVEWMELSVVLSQTGANADPDANGRHLQAEGHETPTWQRPGRGYFTLNSGLHMEASLRLLRR